MMDANKYMMYQYKRRNIIEKQRKGARLITDAHHDEIKLFKIAKQNGDHLDMDLFIETASLHESLKKIEGIDE